jgi:phosphoserine phosphatase
MPHILTLVAPPGGLSHHMLAPVLAALAAGGADCRAPDWLSEGEALDIPFSGMAPAAAQSAAQAALAGQRVDAIVQSAATRRKALLLADMDSTIVTTETLDELAAEAGLKERIAAITARAMNGELDFKSALRERVAMLKGLPEAALQRTWETTELMPGARALVATMRAAGAHAALVSGGFTFFTGRVAALVGFHEHHANQLILADGALAGTVAEPILDRDSKLATLLHLTQSLGLPMERTLTVGDGANDLPMLQAAGLGIAFRAKPTVQAQAQARVNHGDLTALLFAQGFRRAEFATV